MSSDRNCLHCGKPIPPERRSDSLYCSESHRKYASKKRAGTTGKKRKADVRPLSGISNDVLPKSQPLVETKKIEKPIIKPVEVEQPKEQPAVTFGMMPPLRGYVEKIRKGNLSIPPPPEPPAPFNERRPTELPAKYVAYSVNVPNPEYNRLKEVADKQFAACVLQRSQVNEQNEVLKKIQASTNLNALHFILAGTGASYIGGEIAEDKENGKVVGFLVGITAMGLYGFLTHDHFLNEKAKAVEQQVGVLNKAGTVLKEQETKYQTIKKEWAAQSELIPEERTRLDNGTEILQREKEIQEYDQRKDEAHQLSKEYSDAVAEYEKQYGSIELLTKDDAEEPTKPMVETDGVVSSVDLNKKVEGHLVLKGIWAKLLGAPSRNFKLVIHGPSFSGKSHLALKLAHYFAVHHGTVLYNTSEEGHSKTTEMKLDKLGAKVPGLDIGNYGTAQKLMEKIPRNIYNFIVLDSVNDMNMTAEQLQEFRNHYCCSATISICQNTKAGDIRGGYDLVHDTDVKWRVEEGIAYNDKNRYNVEPLAEMDVFKIEVIPAPLKEPPLSKQVPEEKQDETSPNAELDKPVPKPETKDSKPPPPLWPDVMNGDDLERWLKENDPFSGGIL